MFDKKYHIILNILSVGQESYFDIDIDYNYTFLDLLKFLLNSFNTNISEYPFDDSCFIRKIDKKNINLSNIHEKVIDYIEEIEGSRILTLYEQGSLMPKNDFKKTNNIVKLCQNGLEKTINIGNNQNNIDIINHGKIGEWVGFGSGPIEVDKCEDNRLVNLVFIKYNDSKPFAYNIYCLFKLINQTEGTILIPHLNMKFVYIKLLQKFLEVKDSEFKILNLNEIDIIHQDLPLEYYY